MNILFLTIGDFTNIQSGGSVHIDLVKKFVEMGHNVIVACVNTHQVYKDYTFERINGFSILRIRANQVKKNTNLIKKGLATISLERKYIKAIKCCLSNVRFNLVLYHTPPVTFEKVVRFVKKRDGANSYLLLKDIFPQNAVDLGMMSKIGLRSVVYWYFRRKEINLYKVSDYIGCMSPANVKYFKEHNRYVNPKIVEVAPNSIDLAKITTKKDAEERIRIRQKYELPNDKPIFIYGGNLGKPQGVDYIVNCLDALKNRDDCYFLIVGYGSEYEKLKQWYNHNLDKSVKLLSSLPKADYDILVNTCDVGLIFLDCRFTIPNYPSRLLSYLAAKIPVICATDLNTDVGRIAQDNGYGYWCKSEKTADFISLINKMLASNIAEMGENGYHFLVNNYLVDYTCQTILNHFDRDFN